MTGSQFLLEPATFIEGGCTYMLANKKQRKLKIMLGLFLLILAVTVGAATYYLNYYKEDFNKQLPMSFTVKADDMNLEDIANSFLSTLIQPYTGDKVSSWKRISEVRFNKFQLLAGDENDFAVAVTFWAKLEKKMWSTHNNWGKVQEDGTVKNIQWTLRIKKTGENEYTLERIEDTSNAVAGLAPVKDTYQKDAGITLPDENTRYQIKNGKLEVTYDNGDHWQSVPVTLEELFAGDYSGSEQTLIDGSYMITPDKTAFVIGEKVKGNNDYSAVDFKILLSTDKGETWEKSTITNSPSVRIRSLGFTSEQDGYLIISYDRTMGFEANAIYTTNDGGENWRQAGSVEQTNRHVTSGGFINEDIGFMSFGAISVDLEPEQPSIYRTADGGESWDELKIPIPIEYGGIFTVAQVPTFDGTQGTLLVNQGPNGDFQGGKVLARFTSVDEGTTWFFSNLVDPDNVIQD